MLSVIIPTLNEEKNITKAVLQFEGISDVEVIVADGDSDDNTCEIAKKLDAKVFRNKRSEQNIAKNRNLGARHAKGDILVFCDADTKLKNPKYAVKKISSVFKNQEYVGGIVKIEIYPHSELFIDKIAHNLYNFLIKSSLDSRKPIGSGQCQIIKKNAFKKVKGYPEIMYQEDTEIFRELRKLGKLCYLEDIVVYESPRRYRRFGYLFLGFRAIYALAVRSLFKRETVNRWERVG